MDKSKQWSIGEKQELERLIDNGLSAEQIANIIGRTANAVTIKANRMGMSFRDNWTKEKDEQLEDLWKDNTKTMKQIERETGRSRKAIIVRATRLKLGSRLDNREDFTLSEISSYMGVSLDRVIHWTKVGLKSRVSKVNKKVRLVKYENLLEFLRENPERYNASLVSEYLFSSEPEWLKNKRKEDIGSSKNEYRVWTKEEKKQVEDLYKIGWRPDKIGKKLNRSEWSVKRVIRERKISTRIWNKEDIEILKNYSDYYTIEEISKMLSVKRTEKAIMYKCESLKLKYHTRKSKCKAFDEVQEKCM